MTTIPTLPRGLLRVLRPLVIHGGGGASEGGGLAGQAAPGAAGLRTGTGAAGHAGSRTGRSGAGDGGRPVLILVVLVVMGAVLMGDHHPGEVMALTTRTYGVFSQTSFISSRYTTSHFTNTSM